MKVIVSDSLLCRCPPLARMFVFKTGCQWGRKKQLHVTYKINCGYVSRQSQWHLKADSDPFGLTRSDEGWVQGFYPIGGHDDFNVSPRVEAIQLVEQLQHGPLDLPLTAGVRVIPTQHRQETLIWRIYTIHHAPHPQYSKLVHPALVFSDPFNRVVCTLFHVR